MGTGTGFRRTVWKDRPLARKLVPVPVFLLCASALAAASDPIASYLDQERSARHVPGLAWAVVEDGRVTRQGALGFADLENRAPVTDSSIFAIASLDKQLTAAGVLEAAEQGKLTLDDPIAKWVDIDLPSVAVRHLLSHTAGLPDQVAGTIEGRGFTSYTTEQLLATVRGLVPVAPPGGRFLYSDAGLFLAQLATEQATGESWWEWMRRELFAPAGMTTPLSMAPEALIPGRVLAYTLDGAGEVMRDRRLDVDYGPLYSDLGMTVGDFARWLASLDGGGPLSATSIREMTTPARLADDRPAGEPFQWSRYGLGVGLDDFLGQRLVAHSGHSGVGFARFPDLHFAVVVFTNLEHPMGSDPVGLALGIAGLLRPELSLARLAPRPPGAAPLAALAATYRQLLAGAPDLERFAPPLRISIFEGSPGLAGRSGRFGELVGFELLAESTVDGERALLVRARHEHATVYVRFSLDADGRVARLVWWHL